MTATPQATDSIPANAFHLRSVGIELRDFLIRAKRAVDEEIGSYPTPIPRCDAQFNHLYEQRSRIARTLDRVSRALDRGDASEDLAAAIVEFAAAPPIIESAEEQRLRQRLDVALPGVRPTTLGAAAPLPTSGR